MADIDKNLIYLQFLEAFPFESLKDMPLEKYTNLNKDDSFCYWLESRTYHLGSIWGGSSYKFGIYKYNRKPNSDDHRIQFDDTYAWYSKYNKESAEEAYSLVRDTIIKIAEFASRNDLDSIDKIDTLGDVFKWKIAFLYSNKSLVPIYKREMLETVAEYFGMENPKQQSISVIQRFLMKQKGDKDLFVFYEELLAIIEHNNFADDIDEDAVTEIIQNNSFAKVNYWLYGPGEKGCMWERCKEQNEICIGWDGTDDLTRYSSREDYQKLLQGMYNQPDNNFIKDTLCLYEFTHVMKPGDVVYVRNGVKKIVGRGIVKGEYFFNDSYDTYRHIHKVHWTHIGEWDAPWQFTQKTLTEIGKNADNTEKMEALFKKDDSSLQPAYWWLVANPKIWSLNALKVGEKQKYSLYNDNGNKRRIFQNFLDAKVGDIVIGYEATPTKQIVALAEITRESDGETIEFAKSESFIAPIDFSVLNTILELQNMEFLKNQQGSLYKLTDEEYNIIIDLIREDNPIQKQVTLPAYTEEDFLNDVYISKDDFNTLKHLIISKKNIILQGAPGVGKTFSAKRLCYALMGEKDESKVEFVQFHQNYSYEDFIMGYKPTEDGTFTLKRGRFYNFCKRAQNDPDPNKKYFFIIDEINRGNMSKIFGELMMLIEKDYRGDKHAIKLAYSDELFSVPENVYIIGMMNTADRSLAMIDYALRRRFSFFDMCPGFDSEGFVKYMERLDSIEFGKVIEAIRLLNGVIEKDDSLGKGFCIGHSYFCNQKSISTKWLKNVIEYDIIPMLREYWFDNNSLFDSESKKLRNALA